MKSSIAINSSPQGVMSDFRQAAILKTFDFLPAHKNHRAEVDRSMVPSSLAMAHVYDMGHLLDLSHATAKVVKIDEPLK